LQLMQRIDEASVGWQPCDEVEEQAVQRVRGYAGQLPANVEGFENVDAADEGRGRRLRGVEPHGGPPVEEPLAAARNALQVSLRELSGGQGLPNYLSAMRLIDATPTLLAAYLRGPHPPERAAATKLEKMGVKIIADVDKASFQKIADPYLDKLAKDLGPHADRIKTLIRAID